jgi:hypothetical protein
MNDKTIQNDGKVISSVKADSFIYGNKAVKSPSISPKLLSISAKKDGDLDDFGFEAYDDYEGLGEMFEDDEDLKALEMEFFKEATADTETQGALSSPKSAKNKGVQNEEDNEGGNDDDNVMKSYFMNMLKAADRDLIDYKVPKGQKVLKRYSTVCQWNDRRQPVVVNKTELDKIKTFQKDINYIKTGSSKELQEKNFYICPQVWCPKSKVALTYKEFKVKYNESCPYPDIEEKPVILTNHYWGKGEKGQTREHYPGFLDAKTHPKQLCLPCCFKKEAKEGTKNKQKENTCKTQWSDEAPVEEDVAPAAMETAAPVADVPEPTEITTSPAEPDKALPLPRD